MEQKSGNEMEKTACEAVKPAAVTAKVNENAAETGESAADRKGVIALSRPYLFEGKEYTEIDLSGLETMTIRDAVEVQREIHNEMDVAALTICETTTTFARRIARRATGLPIEFFQLAPRSVSRQIANAVRRHINNTVRGTENHVMQLEQPYHFKGKSYTEIDLNGIADLNSLNESEAENRLARAGFVVMENTFNYLYACILASMATGLAEEFFTGLPLYELVKLKNAVSDAGFFE